MNTNTAYYSAVQQQNQAIKNKNITPGHYIQKQRDGQIVRVVSKDSVVTMSLPGLAPFFQGSNQALGTNSDDIYYQIKSFRCTNRFFNVKATDRIQIIPLLTATNIESIDYPGGQVVNIPLNYINPRAFEFPLAAEDCVLSAQQIVDNLNQYINISIMQAESQNLAGLPGSLQAHILTFDRGMFKIKNGRLILSYTIDGGQLGNPGELRFFPRYYPALNSGNDYYFASAIETTIRTSPNLNQQDSDRLASIFGLTLQARLDNGVIQYGSDFTFDPNLLAQYTTANYYRRTFNVNWAPNPPPILPRTIYNIPTEIYSVDNGEPMFVFPFTSIYIHSSLQSNLWDQSGRKNDVIAVVPLQGDQTQIPIEYQPPATADRTYNIRDSLASLQSFNIRFTDENNNDIVFKDEYELELAIFFTPKDPIVTSL